ncbi:hypothetical protein EJV47_14625 [Hymenobacter gummosus]|uniref:Uncharacterized protein n=1 Tax=Hymenobacter gummosus TaxID=1776032 RepID=A0A431U143_9BACT|nr:hypothetical protein [Hymenobacter gummosus]RTQ48831.1 hypothetical protein EJV47_14625 [Hymenobacter gummosus]
MPRSPEAAELGKYAELPVSLYTGVPSVDIPLFTLPGQGLSVPIGLRYYGSALRLDEAAPWTGIGWTLQAGGAITRSSPGCW